MLVAQIAIYIQVYLANITYATGPTDYNLKVSQTVPLTSKDNFVPNIVHFNSFELPRKWFHSSHPENINLYHNSDHTSLQSPTGCPSQFLKKQRL
jgi:hypothetical protein